MKIFFKPFVILIFCIICSSFTKSSQSSDGLDKRLFKVTFSELKVAGPPSNKSFVSDLEFKINKGVRSDYMNDNTKLSWVKYEILKDSSAVDEYENENRFIECKATTTIDGLEYTYKISIENTEIEGTVTINKGDKLKKQFDFFGKEIKK